MQRGFISQWILIALLAILVGGAFYLKSTQNVNKVEKAQNDDWQVYSFVGSKDLVDGYSFEYPKGLDLEQENMINLRTQDSPLLQFSLALSLGDQNLKDYVEKQINDNNLKLQGGLEQVNIGDAKGYSYLEFDSEGRPGKYIYLQSPFNQSTFVEIRNHSVASDNKANQELADKVISTFRFNK